MPEKWVRLCATFFYVGYAPFASGTAASFVAFFIAILIHSSLLLYILVTGVITYLGFKTSGEMEKLAGQKDPGCIVIDEVAGALIAVFLLPFQWPVLITAFFLFRAFDMFKIYPVNKLESASGSVGVMMDDLVAGLYTNLIMQVAVRWAGIV